MNVACEVGGDGEGVAQGRYDTCTTLTQHTL
jgi:hypothetical protein